MTPEIMWTNVDSDTFEAWYRGEMWVLLKQSRRTARGPAGWYLHATEGGAVLTDGGRLMDTRIENAPYKATSVILTERIAELQGALDATDRLEIETRTAVTKARDAVYDGRSGEALDMLSDLLESLGGDI